MTRSRIVLTAIALILLGFIGAGFYLHHHLPELLRLQAQRALQQYGVDDIAISGLQISSDKATIDTVMISGSYAKFAYRASLTYGELGFSWHTILNGKADSLSAATLVISVVQTAASDTEGTDTISVDEWLPQQLIAQLPVRALNVPQWTLDYRSPADQQITVHGSLHIEQHIVLQLTTELAGRDLSAELTAAIDTEELQLAVSLQEDPSPIANLSARLTRTSGDDWTWTAQGQVYYAPMLSWLRQLDSERGLELGIPPPNELSLVGESAFTANIQHPNTLHLAAAPASPAAPLRQLKASLELVNAIHQIDFCDSIDAINGAYDVELTMANAQVAGIVKPFKLAGQLRTELLSLPDDLQRRIGWQERVALELESQQPLAFTLAPGPNASVQWRNASVTLGDENSSLRVEKLNLDAKASSNGEITTNIQLSTNVDIRIDKQALPTLDFSFKQHGTLAHSDVALQMGDTTQGLRSDLQGTINLQSGSGDFRIDTRIAELARFTTTTTALLEHFDVIDAPLEISTGSVALTTALTTKRYDVATWKQQSQLTLENVSGNFNDYKFENLAISANWSGTTQWKTLKPADITLASLNPGFAIQDIQLQLSLPTATPITQPKFKIEALTANMFGGQLTLPQAQSWDFAATINHFTLSASQWQLGELVALQKSADIQAKGTLDGELPLSLSGGRVMIENGFLRARPPGGSIRYVANDAIQASAQGNTQLALALLLLSDFQYQSLGSEVQLDNAGNLLLSLSLAGSNPAQFNGQPIQFNINVEQNVDPLLQSLRLSGNLVKRIEGGLK